MLNKRLRVVTAFVLTVFMLFSHFSDWYAVSWENSVTSPSPSKTTYEQSTYPDEPLETCDPNETDPPGGLSGTDAPAPTPSHAPHSTPNQSLTKPDDIPSATPVVTESPSPEPKHTASPPMDNLDANQPSDESKNERYTDKDTFQIRVTVNGTPPSTDDAGELGPVLEPLCIEAALEYQTEDHTWQIVDKEWAAVNGAERTEPYDIQFFITAGNRASASVSMKNLPVRYAYRARLIAINGINADTLRQYGMTVAYFDRPLLTRVTLRWRDMVNKEAADEPMLLEKPQMDADDEPTLSEGPPAHPFIQEPTGMASFNLPVLDNQPEQSDLFPSILAASALFQAVDVTIRLYLNYSDNDEDAAVTIIPLSINDDEPEVSLTVPCAGNPSISYAITLTADENDHIVYTVRINALYHIISSADKISGEVNPDGTVDVTFSAVEKTALTFKKHWYDNNDVRSRYDVTLRLQAKQISKEGAGWYDTGDKYELNGDMLEYDPYSDTFSDLPLYDAEGYRLAYRVIEAESDSVNAKLYIQSRLNNGEIINTKKTSLTVYKVWKDAATYGETRPSFEDWRSGIQLIRIAYDDSIEIVDAFTVSTSDETLSTWELMIDNLPAYDETGYAYTYYIEEQTDGWKDCDAIGSYETAHQNKNEFRDKTSGIYNGGSSVSTMVNDMVFTFKKTWKDGDGANRPQLTYKLYRVIIDPDNPEGTVPSIITASPVPKMDTMIIPGGSDIDFNEFITYTGAGGIQLPMYDQDGRQYLYFAVENLSGNTVDYVIEIDNGGPYLFDTGEITNRKKANYTPSVRKRWYASAIQSMDASCTFSLQRNEGVLNDDGIRIPDWQTCGDMTITGFTAEMLDKSGSFSGDYPKYDADGYPYEYRVVESGAVINGETAVGDFEIGGVFSAYGYSFRISEANGVFYNTLIGETSFGVRKVWSPASTWESESNPSITIEILQNGTPYRLNPEDLPVIDGMSVSVNNTSITLTMTDFDKETDSPNFTAVFDNLPKYTATGGLYEYNVREISCTSGYIHKSTGYTIEGTVPTGVLTNIAGGEGPTLVFYVSKQWLDDSDQDLRRPVTMTLFFLNEDDVYEPVRDIQLSVGNSWYQEYYYAPNDSDDMSAREWQYDNYLIRETKVGESEVIYNTYSDFLAGIGRITDYNQQLYSCTHIKTATNGYRAINLRYGTLSVIVDKSWAVGEITGLVSEFTVYGNGDAVEKLELPQGTASVTFDNLPKYDDQGVIISYTLRETGLKKAGDAVFTLISGGAVYLVDVGMVSHSIAEGAYVIGSQRTNDTMSYSVSNIRTESNNLTVNKVWRDENENAPRPDIALSLSRKSTKPGAPEQTLGGDRVWNTGTNQWLWTCDFGNMPKYDAEGYLYEYYVRETILQSGSYYHISYNNEGILPNVNGTTSEAVYAAFSDGSSYARAEFKGSEIKPGTEPGIIINTIARDMSIPGSKYWLNYPAWFNPVHFPTVYIHLYCMPKPDYEAMMADNPESMYDSEYHINQVELANGARGFEFEDLPQYTEYGVPYVYYLLETQDAEGQNDTPVQGYYVDYSKTDLSVYNIYDNDPASMAYVKITVFKNWRWPEKDTDQLRYPNVTFDLYQQWMIDEKILYSEQVDTITLTGGIIEDYEDGKHWYTFGQDASLPYFAPDGTVYEYIVKERAINGYQNTEMTPTDGKVRLEKEDNRLYSGTVSFTNAYTPNSPDPCVLTAYKVWNDESNAYGTRPDIGDAQEALGYSLWRRTASISEEKLDKINFNWAQDSAPNNNRWVATISTSTDSGFSFPKYATTGESYTYFVKEELAAPYKDAYVLSSGSGTLSLTNTLKTCQVSANKQWKDGEAPLSAAQLADLTHFGLPTTLRFAVQYRFEDEEWRPYLLIDSSPLNRDVSAEELFSGGTISFTNWLPLYREKDGKPVRVQYRVCETEMSFDNGDSFVTVIYDNGDAPESVPGEDLRMMTVKQEDFLFGDANGNGTHTSTISNNLSVQKLYFVKIWDDDGNRDGRRPDEIIFSISQDNSTYGRDISLTKDTLSDQSTGSSDKDNTWYAECWATVYIEPGEAAVYTVTEECPAFYAQSYETFDSKTLTWTFTNEAAIDVVTLQAQKAWAGETPWTVRPDSVLLTLEQKDGDGDAWRPTESSDLPTGVSSFVNPVEVTYKAGIEKWADIAVEVWKDIASWSGLPVHQLREDPTDDPVPIYYRVSEEDTAMGYISVSTVVVPMEYKDDESTEIPVIILTNTLETVQLTGSKIWDDSDDWYKRRPKLDAESGDPNITLTVLADDTEMNPQPEIVWTSSTYITEPLPKYAYNSDKIVVYAVQETPIPVEYEAKYELSTSNKYQTDITNTLETTSVSGKKTWSDNANHYLYRPEILELKVYIEDSEEPMDIQPKATDIIWDKPEGTDEWIYTIVNLPKYIESGAQIARYVVREEIPLGGYALQNAETAGNGSWNELTGQVTEANFTNTLETISITGSKKWEDESNKYGTRPEPEDFKLTVYQNNVLLVPQPAEDDIEWVETDTDVWHYTIVNLPKKMKDSNSDAQYIIRESFHHGYDASHDIVKDDSGKITEVNIINTLITIPLTVTKVWDDYSNYYDTRPDGLALTVYADNKVMIPQPDMKWSKDLDSEGIWSLKVTGLPRYNKITGKPIVYLVEEATLEPSYASDADDGVCQANLVTEATIEDYLAASFTNTLKMVSISGTKTWDDDDNHYGHRPAELVLTVLANGDPLQRPKEGPDDETEYWTFIVQSGDDDFSKPWSYLIEGLPMYIGIGNEPVVYSVREAVPNGYSTDNEELEPSPAGVPDIMDANFTNTLETTSISGKKFWNDNGNHYLYRPEILELKVYIEDSEEPIDIQPKTTDIIWDKPEGTDEWIYTIIGLPKYLEGSNQIARYVVQEEVPLGGYELQNAETAGIGTRNEVTGQVTEANFTNTLETISITGSKIWEDESNKYGTRPEPEDFKLTVYQSEVLTPQPADGDILWEELSPQPAADDIKWEKTDTVEWSFTIENLPRKMKDSNSDAQYIVRESFHHGYDASQDIVKDDSGKITEVNIINTLITIPLTVTKTWNDYHNAYDTRPDDLALTVFAGNEVMVPPSMIPEWVKNEENDTWSLTIMDLPRFDKTNGEEIIYFIKEAITEPYSSGFEDDTCQAALSDDKNSLSVSFINTLRTVSISGTKTWEDDNNHYGHRPAELVLTVLQANDEPLQRLIDGSKTDTEDWIVTVNPITTGNTWLYTIPGLPMYGENGLIKQYSVQETIPSGYWSVNNTFVVELTNDTTIITGADFTNKLETTSISGEKTWDDYNDFYEYRPDMPGNLNAPPRPSTFELEVYIEGDEEPFDPQPLKSDIVWIKLENANVWSYKIDGLPKYIQGEDQIARYVVREVVPLGGYKLQNDEEAKEPGIGEWDNVTGEVTEANFTNTLETISITGIKIWEDESNKYRTRPDFGNITLTVYQSDEPDELGMPFDPQHIEWEETDNENVWQYTIATLPKKIKGTDTDVYYTVEETVPFGYKASANFISGNRDTSGDVTGADLINTLITIPLTVTKNWEDYNNYYGTRPDDLTLTVYADGVPMESQPVIPPWIEDPADDTIWTLIISGLPRYRAGTTDDIIYSIKEEDIPDSYLSDAEENTCQAALSDDKNSLSVSFTNTLRTVSISGTKTWEDDNNHYGHRPAELLLTILANGDPLQRPKENPDDEAEYWTFTVAPMGPEDSSNTWDYLITGLPMYDENGPILYSIREAVPNWYSTEENESGPFDAETSAIVGADFTNKLETIDLRVIKHWDDLDDFYGNRPEDLEFTIYQGSALLDPQLYEYALTWEKTGSVWSLTLPDLPKYHKDDGVLIEYKVIETTPDCYETTSNISIAQLNDEDGILEASFANSLKTVSISGTKTWEDDGDYISGRPDNLHTRPDNLTFTVMLSENVPLQKPAATSEEEPADWTCVVEAPAIPSEPWRYTIDNLPMYVQKERVNYSVKETVPFGYEAVPSTTTAVNTSGTADFTNKLITIPLKLTKVWEDYGNHYDTRPNGLSLTVYADDVLMNPQPHMEWAPDPEDANTWSWTVIGLPRFNRADGVPIVYHIAEATPESYTSDAPNNPVEAQTGTDAQSLEASFTNTLKTVSISGLKEWKDGNNYFLSRPESLVLTVLDADGNPLTRPKNGSEDVTEDWTFTVTPSATGNTWSYTIEGLPMYDANGLVTNYFVQETVPPGYKPTNATVLVNFTDETVSVADVNFENTLVILPPLRVVKHWDDHSNAFLTRPDDLELIFYADGVEMPNQPFYAWDKTDIDKWTLTVSDLPRFNQDDKEIIYAVFEVNPVHYETKTGEQDFLAVWGVDDNGENILEIVIRNTLQTVTIEGVKIWEDDDDYFGLRPNHLVLTVLANSNPLKMPPLNADGTFTVAGQTGNTWSYRIENLPMVDDDDELIEYQVMEAVPSGYTALKGNTTPALEKGQPVIEGADFTNALVCIPLTVKKVWDDDNDAYGNRPDDLSFTVYADGEEMYPKPKIPDWEPNPDDNAVWTLVIEGLPRCRADDTGDIVYSIKEDTPAPYSSGVTDNTVTALPGTDNEGMEILEASFINTPKTVSISGTKTWLDDGDIYGYRPATLLLTVLADGQPLKRLTGDTIWTHTVNKPTESSDTWDYTIDSLPMYINGKLVSYSVKETLPTGYKTEAATAAKAYEGETGHVDELNFINELDTFSLTITKTWDDFSNTYNTRPNDLALTIYANATPLHPQPVLSWQKDNVKGVWTLTANGLPRYHQDGSLYRYSVKESSLEKYDSFGSTSDDSDGRFVVTLVTDVEGEAAFTNKLKRVSLSGIKTWEDKDNYYGYRPDKLELTVLADGDPLKGMPLANDGAFTVDKQAGNLWTYSIDNLPMYAAGDEPIQYAIQETMPAGYEALANGLAENLIREDAVLTGADLINTLAVISVSGKKTWLDNGNKYVTRPDLYDIRLLVCDGDGVPLPKQPPAEDIEWTDNADNTWSYIIYNLPRYQKGFMTEVMYRVIETADADGDYLPLYENTAKRAADGTIYDMNITNVLRPIVAIYNVTDGIAANGNKVGGYVSAGYGNPVKHNFDEGTGECLYVSWKPETNWVASPAVSLTYWLLDSDTPVTVAITPNDISALTNGDFPSARCHTDANGIITLTFANHVLDMPRRVEVDVSFLPTIAVINTTPQQTGGQVHVENGVWNSNHDGIGNRYVEKTVHGKANDNFVVDLTQITVQSASGGFPAVKLNLSANGSFKTQFITNLGGVNQVVPVEGRVLVNKRNANGQPIDITIMLDKLPCPVDLGILFLSVPPVILPTPTPTPTPVLTPTPTPTPRPSFTPTPTPTPTPTHTPPPLPSMPPDERAFDTVWILDDGSVPLGVGILMTLGDCFD